MEERTYIQKKCNKCYSSYYVTQVSNDGKDWVGNQKSEPIVYLEEKPCPYCKDDDTKASEYLRTNIKTLVKDLSLKLSKEKKYPVVIKFPNNDKRYVYYTDKRLEKGIYKNPFNNTLCELISGNEETFFLLNNEQLITWNESAKKFSCSNVTKELLSQEKESIESSIDEKNFSKFEEITSLISYLLKGDFNSYINKKRP